MVQRGLGTLDATFDCAIIGYKWLATLELAKDQFHLLVSRVLYVSRSSIRTRIVRADPIEVARGTVRLAGVSRSVLAVPKLSGCQSLQIVQ
jgi:hypothetical protein